MRSKFWPGVPRRDRAGSCRESADRAEDEDVCDRRPRRQRSGHVTTKDREHQPIRRLPTEREPSDIAWPDGGKMPRACMKASVPTESRAVQMNPATAAPTLRPQSGPAGFCVIALF